MKIECPHCHQRRDPRSVSRTVRRWGTYSRKSDGQTLARFWCFPCRRTFSAAAFSPLRHQKKRHLNRKIVTLLTKCMSQRDVARELKTSRRTVVRKFRLAAKNAPAELKRWNEGFAPAVEVEFDDLETFEHTKCKPLSVTLMVEFKTRRVLGYEVAQMPAKGPLAAVSRKKYGPRPDHRPFARQKLFAEIAPLIAENAMIRSDSNPHYAADVRRFFPRATYQTVLGKRGAVVGQGELKKIGFDPLFSLNHTCAMLRARINRLVRRTWSTTKKPEELRAHIALYVLEHNRNLATR